MSTLFQSALLVGPQGAALGAPLNLARALVRPGGRLRLLTQVELPLWEPDVHAALEARLDNVEAEQRADLRQARDTGFQASASVCVEPTAEQLGEEAGEVGALLLLLHGFAPGGALRPWLELGLEAHMALAWPGRRPIVQARTVLVPLPPGLEDGVGLVMLLGRLRPERVVAVGVQGSLPPRALLEDLREGTGGRFHLMEAPLVGLRAALEQQAREWEADLVLTPAPGWAGAASGLLTRVLAPAVERLEWPVLIAPGAGRLGGLEPRWEATELLRVGDRLLGQVEQVDPLGGGGPLEQEAVVALDQGRRVAGAEVRAGRLELHPEAPLPVGLVGLAPADGPEPLLRVRTGAHVVQLAPGRIALFDARRPPSPAVRAALGPNQRWWGVRLDPEDSLAELRAGLRAAGLRILLDAQALLEDGPVEELPAGHEGLRLLRAARWLRAQGAGVDLVLARGRAEGFAALDPAQLEDPAGVAQATQRAWRAPLGFYDRLGELSWSRPTSASALILEHDNQQARESLLRSFAQARLRIHLQVYMFHDDRVGQQVVQALAEAAGRGVQVRVLVDSVWSRHGSFGQQNPALARLAAQPGVQVRQVRPLSGVPSLDGLKGRDHRKLALVDGRVAVIGGRNIGDTYYTGFDEVALHPQTPQHEVPWMDLSARLEGAVVGGLEALFAEAWRGAGGDPPETLHPGPPGELQLRLVNHESLRDTCTLDTYRALIDDARAQVTVVNTFPMQQELLDALARAVRRGVRVRVLLGHVRPLRGDGEPFPGGAVRQLMTEIVHARMDALVQAGAEVYTMTLPPRPGWDPALGAIQPHVHTKLLSVDGARFTLGSANLDLSAGYWESEALLVVEDTARTAALDAQIAAWLEPSTRLDPGDPAWRDRASRRAWLARRWPMVLT